MGRAARERQRGSRREHDNRKRKERAVPRIQIPDPAALPHDDAVRAETKARVQKAIGDFPPTYRIVLVMRDMEQLSTQEVADALSLEISAVKMRLHRARLMVRKSLEGSFAADRREGGRP